MGLWFVKGCILNDVEYSLKAKEGLYALWRRARY